MLKNQQESKISDVEIEDKINIDDIQPIISINKKNVTKMKKGKGRRIKNSKEFCMKSKDSNENICKKIKTHFFKFLIFLVNYLIYDYFKEKKYVFRKLNNSFSKNSIQFNKELFEKPIREILIQDISSKFRTIKKNSNKEILLKLENYYNFKIFFSFELKYIYLIYISKYFGAYKDYNFQSLLENEKNECYKNNINDLNFDIEKYLKKFENIGTNFYKFISSKIK